jgi:hypothetical protein
MLLEREVWGEIPLSVTKNVAVKAAFSAVFIATSQVENYQ